MTAQQAETHSHCPEYPQQWFNKSSGDCSCGGNHRGQVVEVYLVSFGTDYKREPHPVLGYWPELGEDAVLEVYAANDYDARVKVFELIDRNWCALYGPTNPPGWDALNLGSLEAAVKDPKPTSWTVGAQVTLNADGTVELHMEDVTVDLTEEGAPPTLVRTLDEILEHSRPEIVWADRNTQR